ncbi:MAG: autotransporter outer membrane beta-barrel domain-containing protein, partial [Gammaproteobacteria bacterium AqS3]|nr:autotransporter outer membrane beta-barrel domain-containing protein [Gammaproteobacteria bacterium AqS3]
GRMSITVDDDERAGLSVTGTPVRVDEGGAANFQIALASRPSGDVAVALSSPDTAIVTVSPGRLDFTASNWDEPQTVRVAGVEDVDPDNQRLQLALRASGGDYAGISTTATVEVTDNDSPNLLLPSTTLRTVEGGASADFRVRLSTLPAGDVTVNASVAVQDAAEAGITAGAELTFTASDWNVEQTISVAPLDDFDAVDEEVRIELRASGADYSSVTRHVTLNIADDDEASLVLSEQALQLAEGASSRSLTVRLSSQPTHNVIISVASDHDSVEAVTQNLAFSPAQWDAPQALALSSPEDDDGLDHTAHIRLEASGGDYTGMSASLQVSVADNDTQALRLSGETVTLTEGGEGSFTVALATPPSGSVIVSVSTDSTALATVSPARLLFAPVHWSTPQTVTVTGHQDDNASDEEVALALSASGADYQGISASLTANISDDEQAGLALSQRALQLTEGGSSRALEVSLLIQPTVPVTLHTASTSSLLLANPGTLIFTPSNWGQVQTMRIRSLDDDDLEDGVETLTLSANGGEYEGVSAEVVVSVLDNDRSPGLSVSATQIDLSEGSSAHFTVQLNSPPSADLTVSMASPGTADPVVIAPVQLTFNGDNWNTPQRISIKALQDDNAVGERIVLQLRGDGAAEYRNLTASVALTLSDDETVGLRVTRQGVEMGASTLLMLEEGGGMTVHVELLTEPVQPVTLDIITGSAAKVVTVPDRLSFTSSNWRGGRLVQISAQQDEDRQDEAAVPIEFRTDESSGPYFGQSVRFHVAITDDDEGAPIEEERMAVERTLNEVARTVITGATEVMGYRLDAGLGSRTGTFAGREIDLGKPGDAGEGPASWTASGEPDAAGRFDADWFGHERMSGNWFGGVELERGRPVHARSDEVDSRAPFIGDFIYALDSGLRTDGEYGSGWTVWGRFDQRNFSGAFQQSRPGVDGTQRVSVDGAQTGFWIGIDQRVSERLLYGFAISHGSGDTEYNLHRFDGAMQTTLSTVMPYLEFETENGLSMRFMYGLGSGTAELQDSGRQKAEAGLQVGMASMGLHWPMLHLGRSTLALTGGLSTSRVRTSQETSASLRSLKASNYRLRGGVEFGHSGFGKGWRIAPRIGLSLRQDEGEDSGVNGIGTELHATLRLSTPLNRVGIELNTHWLNARADEQMDETGASMEFRISGRDAAGRGLSMRIGPEWGARRDGVLDRDDAFNLEQGPQIGSDERRQRSALGADLGYSLDALGGMLTPYTEYRLTAGVHASEQRSAGLRFRRADQLQTRLFFEQRINQGADDTAGLGFEFSRRF